MIDTEAPEFRDFIDAVGRLVLSWAVLEVGLDFCVVGVNRHHLDDETQTEVPRALRRKIDYLRRAFKVIPAMEGHRETFLGLLDDIVVASEQRHDLIHGFIKEQIGDDIRMIRLLRDVDGFRPRHFTVTPATILREANHANKLGRYVGRLALALSGREPDA